MDTRSLARRLPCGNLFPASYRLASRSKWVRCGMFLTSYITPVAIYRDLASLFRQSCPAGLVVYVAQHPEDDIPDADILLSVQDEPRAVIQKNHLKQEKKAS